jgi:hypothetical protein
VEGRPRTEVLVSDGTYKQVFAVNDTVLQTSFRIIAGQWIEPRIYSGSSGNVSSISIVVRNDPLQASIDSFVIPITGRYSVHIFFRPQNLLNIGILLSSISFVAIAIPTVYSFRSGRKRITISRSPRDTILRIANKIHRHRYLLASIGLSTAVNVVVFRQLILGDGFALWGDNNFALFSSSRFSMWNSYGSIQQLIWGSVAWLPWTLLVKALALPDLVAEKMMMVLYLVLSSTGLALVSHRIIGRNVFENKSRAMKIVSLLAISFGAVFFWVNPYMTTTVGGPFYVASAGYASLPLLSYLGWNYLEGRHLMRNMTLIAVILSVSAIDFRFAFFLVWAFFAGMVLAQWWYGKALKPLGLRLLRLGALSLTFVATNAYAILPYLSILFSRGTSPASVITGYHSDFQTLQLFSRNASLVSALTLTNGWWQIVTLYPGQVSDWVVELALLAIPLAAILGFVRSDRRNSYLTFHVLTLTVACVAVSGYNSITGALYGNAFADLSALGFGWVLRLPEVFEPFLIYAYSVLLTFAVAEIVVVKEGASLLAKARRYLGHPPAVPPRQSDN